MTCNKMLQLKNNAVNKNNLNVINEIQQIKASTNGTRTRYWRAGVYNTPVPLKQ